MKANKKFIEDSEAVSAVIGVILMVAITVAIAATVYVYVSGMIGGGDDTAPNITFQKDDINNYLQVVDADPGSLNWENINLTTDGAYGDLTLGGTAYGNGDTCPSAWGQIKGGQKLNVGDAMCNITIRWIPTNTLLGEHSFT